MAQQRKFLKLGHKATSFSDATTEVNLVNDAVAEVTENQLALPHIAERLQHGHLNTASQAEFDAYQAKAAKLKKEGEKEFRKRKKKLALLEVDDDDSEEDSDEAIEDDTKEEPDEDDDEEEDDDDEPSKTKESMIADLKASTLVDEKKKATLSSLTLTQLIKLHNKITGK